MKKKLNLLWNLKFNFFSVAERPLTFFAYFLNAKKVGRRRLVIVPATAGGLPLFPHAASCSRPRPCSRSVAFRLRRNRASGHRPRLLGLPRKSGRGISLRETTLCGCPLRGHDFVTPHQCFGLPRFRFAQAWPLGQQPAPHTPSAAARTAASNPCGTCTPCAGCIPGSSSAPFCA